MSLLRGSGGGGLIGKKKDPKITSITWAPGEGKEGAARLSRPCSQFPSMKAVDPMKTMNEDFGKRKSVAVKVGG